MSGKQLLRLAVFLSFLAGGFYFLIGRSRTGDLSGNILGDFTKKQAPRWPFMENLKEEAVGWWQEKGGEIAEKSEKIGEIIPQNQEEKGEEIIEQLEKSLKNLPQEQLAKVKEEIIKQVFPDCQCRCYFEENND